MLERNLALKCDQTFNYLIIRRGLRSVRVAQERLKILEKKHAQEEELLKANKEKQLAAWKEEDENKLRTWTAWRRSVEDQEAKKQVPLPLSLTGFGDGARPRYWTLKLRKALTEWIEANKHTEPSFADKIPASIKNYLANNGSILDDKFKPLCDKLAETQDQPKETAQSEDDDEQEKRIQFPFELLDDLRKSDPEFEDNEITKSPKLPSGIVDRDYENYLKHNEMVQHFALNLKKVRPMDYEDEIRAWGAEVWRRNYGSPDPSVPASNVPCGGCGSHLHCTNQTVPGYMPSERFTQLTRAELKSQLCQRCDFLQSYNICLDVNVSPDIYPTIISEIQQKDGIVILMVDLTDFPASIWPNIIHLVGKNRKIYVVGNKVDLLPKDGIGYLTRIENSLKDSLKVAGTGPTAHVRHTCLISAKTGYGVESLVTKLLKDDNGTRDIYLIGCTNVGKSTLFNALLQSDLCKTRGNDLIQRATTSVWPGTTMNLLKFPLTQMRGWQLRLRYERLRKIQKPKAQERELRYTLYRQTKNPRLAILSDRVDTTFRENIPFTVESGHPMATRHQVPKPFDPNSFHFQRCKFFHDTPGSIYKEQLLTLLTTEELLKTIPRETIIPRTFSLWPFQTLFLAGLGRVDLVHARQNVLLTVFASHYLPIHVVFTEQAKQFYNTFLGSRMLGVPLGGPARLARWPVLVPKEIDFTGIGWKESCGDIVLSSAGWVSVTASQDSGVVLKAYTPEGRGISTRQPSLLPFAVNLRGKKIEGTPCFEAERTTVDEIGDDGYDHEWIYKKKHPNSIPPYKEEPLPKEKRYVI